MFVQNQIVHLNNHQDVITAEIDKADEMLFEYTQNWIDIPKFDSRGISALWRGWYIIPDQGYVMDEMMQHLKSYLPFIDGGI